jgi:hypothetical protein
LKPNTFFFFFSKNSGINPGQPVGKGQEKNPGINPGQPAGKGGKKKNPGINPRQPAGKGREKKNPGINPGQPAGKGWKKKKKPWYYPLLLPVLGRGSHGFAGSEKGVTRICRFSQTD